MDFTPVTVKGKTALVIGGTSGIGEALALGFAQDGADVVASSRSGDRVSRTAEDLRNVGASTLEVTCDVTRRESLKSLRDRIESEFDELDLLVNSPGAISRMSLEEITESEWRRVLDVQLNGVYRACQVFAPILEGGSIINISSLAARLSLANAPAYSAAKGGSDALTRAAAKELAPEVRVNAIAPGFVITPQNEDVYREGTRKRRRIDERTPLGRVARREEMIGAAIYLGSDAASYTTGEVLTVDGGFTNGAL